MNRRLIFLLIIFSMFCCNYTEAQNSSKKNSSPLYPQNPKGHLFIIGGGDRPDSLMARFLELGGGKNARALVIPFSSGDMDDSGNFQVKQFERIGCEEASYIKCAKEEVDSPENLARLDGITAIFFSGGDQNKHTEFLLGTKFLEKVREIYKNGGVIGGSSAGAAVMSKIMLTGKEGATAEGDGNFKVIKTGNVQTAEGLGFVTSAIIDQHFIVRKRENRLISLVIENPGLKGIGIDESTAIIIAPNGECTVAGESGVMLFENDKMKITNGEKKEGDYQSARSICLSILLAGEKFKL